jgi:hypothetical protein
MWPRIVLDYSVMFAHMAPVNRLLSVEAGVQRRSAAGC